VVQVISRASTRRNTQLIDQDQVDAAVAGDQLGQLPLVGGFGEFVDQFAGEGIADS
jgi:hypothetical protein